MSRSCSDYIQLYIVTYLRAYTVGGPIHLLKSSWPTRCGPTRCTPTRRKLQIISITSSGGSSSPKPSGAPGSDPTAAPLFDPPTPPDTGHKARGMYTYT